MSYHHFGDVKQMTSLLVKHIKPNGSLLIADIIKTPRHESEPALLEKYKEDVAHLDGFSEEDIRSVFEGAGLTDFEFVNATTASIPGQSREISIFLAKGTAQ